MADEQQDDSQQSPIVDMVKGAFKKANDWINGAPAPKVESDHEKAISEMNKQADAQRVAEATKSFAHPTQTEAQKKVSAPAKNGKTVVKPAPRKRG